MSEENEVDTPRCASCGVTQGDDVKLKDCSACHLVKYCGVNCQKEHRKKHKRDCKKRAAELHDELLFKQPEGSYLGDCPICFLPHSIDEKKSMLMSCCGKSICRGCGHANLVREMKEKLVPKCPFCRTLTPSETEYYKRLKDKEEMNDSNALCDKGYTCCESGDYQTAFQCFSKAAKSGDVAAHHNLASMYYNGRGVEKDESKAVYHYEQAAIGGHPHARFDLGVFEWINGRRERAIKHWIIAAKLGDDKSLDELKKKYKNRLVSKDDLSAALRGYQAAEDAAKSPQRDEAEAYYSYKSLK